MNEASSDQSEALLQELEQRVCVQRQSSEAIETQLKAMLGQLRCDPVPRNERVARIAKVLAACLGNRGDWKQAELYVTMACNLEEEYSWAQSPAGDPSPADAASQAAAASSLDGTRDVSAGAGQDSIGASSRLPRSLGSWFGLNRRVWQRLGR